jgi:hypothetical protein
LGVAVPVLDLAPVIETEFAKVVSTYDIAELFTTSSVRASC